MTFRSVFFGTPAFAVPCLDALAEISEVCGVVCQPDKPQGRGHVVAAPPVKARALELGLDVFQPEKVRDVKAIFARTGTQRFVFFGDTSQRDPEVYKEARAASPERVVAVFIHKVDAVVPPTRVEGMFLHESYAEVAAILFGLGVVGRDEARGVMESAKEEGLTITSQDMDALLEKHKPR